MNNENKSRKMRRRDIMGKYIKREGNDKGIELLIRINNEIRIKSKRYKVYNKYKNNNPNISQVIKRKKKRMRCTESNVL